MAGGRREIVLTPIEVAIDEMQTKVSSLREVINNPLPNAMKLQLNLQGCVSTQVSAPQGHEGREVEGTPGGGGGGGGGPFKRVSGVERMNEGMKENLYIVPLVEVGGVGGGAFRKSAV